MKVFKGILLLSTMAPMEGSFMGKIFHERLNKRWKIVILLAQIVLLGNPQILLTFIILFVLYYYMGIKVLRGVSGDLIGAIITLSFPILLLVAERGCYPYFISLFSLI
ncbi:MAG: adenosylcobinamide-GDP ribazoletransferase [Sulfolobus sp.]|nr:adenosylcobinamide-GDP ribazoletransferase [Sulfolobus sp.]